MCVLKDGEVVGHLKRGKRGCFAKTIFYFLEADQHSSCSVIIKADKAVNFGEGDGMQVPCKLRISGQEKFVNILKELEREVSIMQLYCSASDELSSLNA